MPWKKDFGVFSPNLRGCNVQGTSIYPTKREKENHHRLKKCLGKRGDMLRVSSLEGYFCSFLVGGFNPFENYCDQNGIIFPKFSG